MKKGNLILIINIIIIILSFILVVNYQQYSYLFEHDNFWANGFNIKHIASRIPGTIITYVYNIILPNLLSVNLNDFKSSIGAYIVAIPYILICLIFSKCFFIFSPEKYNILKRKEFIIIFPLSFLLISMPLPYIYSDSSILYFLGMDEIASSAEYCLGYIFLFLFYIIIIKTIIYNEEFSRFKTIIYCFGCFLLGLWNELLNLSSLFTLILLIVLLFIFDKKKLKNKSFILISFSFLLGFLCFYILGDHLSNHSLNTLPYNLIENQKENFHHLPLFINKYIEYMFKEKFFGWLLFIISSISLLKYRSNKKTKYIFLICTCIIWGYLFTSLIQVFIYQLKPGIDYMFERQSHNCIQCNMFEFAILTLLGYVYYNCQKQIKYFITIFLTLIFILLSIIFTQNYIEITNNKFIIKSSIYRIEKINLLYYMLEESAILPASYLDLWEFRYGKIFTMQDQFEYRYKPDFKEFMLNKYFDKSYSLYAVYFEDTYKKPFLGFQFKEDDIANIELEKRLKLFNDKMETDEELKKAGVNFSSLKKYLKKLTIQDIEELEKQFSDSEVLIKCKAHIYFENSDYDNSLKLYKIYLIKNPDDYDALLNIASIYKTKNDFEAAKNIYKKLMTLDDNNLTFIYLYLDIIFNQDKNYKESLNLCNKMINIENRIPNLYINKALIYKELKDNQNMLNELQYLQKYHSDRLNRYLEENNINSIYEVENIENVELKYPTFME